MSEPKLFEMDIRGQVCPSTLLSSLKKINELRKALKEKNVEIVIKTDNRDATNTIPEAVKNMGLAAIVQKVEGYYQIFIRGEG